MHILHGVAANIHALKNNTCFKLEGEHQSVDMVKAFIFRCYVKTN